MWDDLLRAALDSLMEMKRTEGEKMRSVVAADLEAFEDIVRGLEERWRTAAADLLI